ncbi:SRPBCC family protein [Nocardioides sp. InS609-2]|uniref:SRPBCC family protein n=1 Tax=Nocardioides sp. InS609-2 TaxID=2760705 RepID=UPI0020BD9444|nr:SRPBCC family protein [Nocardioides sp. InS609-2]
MSQIQKSIDVDVPVSTAYNQWTQFESFPEFMSGVESITQIGDTRSHWVTNIAGVEREFDTEVSEQHPDERVAWHSVGGDTKHAGVVTFHRLDESRTRVMVQIDWDASGLLEKLGSMVNVDDRQVAKDLDRFKDFIERQGNESGAWRGDVDAGS